jgi:hypothetical protein
MFSRLARVWCGKKALAIASLLLGMLRLALWCLPFRTVRKFVEQAGDRTRAKQTMRASDTERYQAEMIWALQLGGRFLLGDKPCLPQALAIQWLLGRRGVYTDLSIGVKKDDERGIAAHAWVEKEGQIIMGGDMSPVQFKRLHLVKS